MSSLNISQLRAIDQSKELLVPAAEKLLDDARVVDLDRNAFGDSQLRNLTAVAMETESPAVVTNFIRYQMGRDPRGRNWANGTSGQRLGDRFIEEIQAGAIKDALGEVPNVKGNPQLEQLARIELVRHFLGFATRYLKYLDLKRGQRRQERMR